jgi:hypothetical protein
MTACTLPWNTHNSWVKQRVLLGTPRVGVRLRASWHIHTIIYIHIYRYANIYITVVEFDNEHYVARLEIGVRGRTLRRAPPYIHVHIVCVYEVVLWKVELRTLMNSSIYTYTHIHIHIHMILCGRDLEPRGFNVPWYTVVTLHSSS